MTHPMYCPNCGVLLPAGGQGAQPFTRTEKGEGTIEKGWDCYCATCKWSGDIYPDEEYHDQ